MTANLSECDKCFSSNCKLNLCKRVYLIGASMVKMAKCQIENRFIGSSTVDAILSKLSKCPDFKGKNRAEVKSVGSSECSWRDAHGRKWGFGIRSPKLIGFGARGYTKECCNGRSLVKTKETNKIS